MLLLLWIFPAGEYFSVVGVDAAAEVEDLETGDLGEQKLFEESDPNEGGDLFVPGETELANGQSGGEKQVIYHPVAEVAICEVQGEQRLALLQVVAECSPGAWRDQLGPRQTQLRDSFHVVFEDLLAEVPQRHFILLRKAIAQGQLEKLVPFLQSLEGLLPAKERLLELLRIRPLELLSLHFGETEVVELHQELPFVFARDRLREVIKELDRHLLNPGLRPDQHFFEAHDLQKAEARFHEEILEIDRIQRIVVQNDVLQRVLFPVEEVLQDFYVVPPEVSAIDSQHFQMLYQT